MAEKRYIISDASKQVDVEAHVLRYWEEELVLEIPRNEMGHRYYTDENIRLLKNIKELKDQGFQLKAIKMVLPELINSGEYNLDYMLGRKEELNNKAMEEEARASKEAEQKKAERKEEKKEDKLPVCAESKSDTHATVSIAEDKLQQCQVIMTNIMARALAENSPQLGQEISNKVSESVLKEMDYLMRLQDEKEEQRYKKLDEMIRSYQKGRMEAAATSENPKKAKKRRFFRKA